MGWHWPKSKSPKYWNNPFVIADPKSSQWRMATKIILNLQSQEFLHVATKRSAAKHHLVKNIPRVEMSQKQPGRAELNHPEPNRFKPIILKSSPNRFPRSIPSRADPKNIQTFSKNHSPNHPQIIQKSSRKSSQNHSKTHHLNHPQIIPKSFPKPFPKSSLKSSLKLTPKIISEIGKRSKIISQNHHQIIPQITPESQNHRPFFQNQFPKPSPKSSPIPKPFKSYPK